MKKTRKLDIGSELIAGMENALAHARGRKRAARESVVRVRKQKRALTRAAAAASAPAFAKVWNNPNDDGYNRL
jgi:hypothetical protein